MPPLAATIHIRIARCQPYAFWKMENEMAFRSRLVAPHFHFASIYSIPFWTHTLLLLLAQTLCLSLVFLLSSWWYIGNSLRLRKWRDKKRVFITGKTCWNASRTYHTIIIVTASATGERTTPEKRSRENKIKINLFPTSFLQKFFSFCARSVFLLHSVSRFANCVWLCCKRCMCMSVGSGPSRYFG